MTGARKKKPFLDQVVNRFHISLQESMKAKIHENYEDYEDLTNLRITLGVAKKKSKSQKVEFLDQVVYRFHISMKAKIQLYENYEDYEDLTNLRITLELVFRLS